MALGDISSEELCALPGCVVFHHAPGWITELALYTWTQPAAPQLLVLVLSGDV